MSAVRFVREKIPFGLVVLFFAVLITPVLMVSTPARADICSEVPTPANPWTDQFSRIMAPPLDDDGQIAADPNPDPLKHREVPMYEWYGTNYEFFAYDESCNWGTDLVWTAGASTDSSLFAWATYPFVAAYGITGIAMSDSWKSALDSAIAQVTETLGESMFLSLSGIVITVAGVLALWAARVGDVPKVFGQAMWVVCLMGVAAVSIAAPQALTKTADEAVTSVVSAAGEKVPSGVADDGSSVLDPDELTPQDNVLRNLDSINRDVYFRGWLQGQLGDADGVAATKHGGNLFRATHLTWWEGKTVQMDPEGEGQEILDRKETLFKDTVDAIEEDDPAAFEHLKGQGVNRLGTVVATILQAWLSLPFYVVAMIAVALALVTIRIVVMLLPMLTIAGMMEPSRLWMLGVLQKYSKNVVIAPFAFVGALVNVTVVGALFRSDLPMVVKVFLSVVVMVILWTLIKPPVLPGGVASRMGGLVRRAVGTAAGIKLAKAAGGGEQDAETKDGDTTERTRTGGGERPRKESRPVAGAVESGYIGEDRQLPASTGRTGSGTEVSSATRPAAGSGSETRWVPVTRTSGGGGAQPEDYPAEYRPAAGTSGQSGLPAGASRRELPAAPSEGAQEKPNPWVQDAPTPRDGTVSSPSAGPTLHEGGDSAPSAGTGQAQRSVPVVYTSPPSAAPPERPETNQTRPVVTPEGADPQPPAQEQASARAYEQDAQEVPVRNSESGEAREPDAVWMPESHRPTETEHEGVSEANLQRDDEGNQTFVVWVPESSQGGEQR